MCDKRDRAITCILRRNPHLTLMFSGLCKNICLKESKVKRKFISNEIIVTLVTQSLSSWRVSLLAGRYRSQSCPSLRELSVVHFRGSWCERCSSFCLVRIMLHWCRRTEKILARVSLQMAWWQLRRERRSDYRKFWKNTPGLRIRRGKQGYVWPRSNLRGDNSSL